MPISVLVINNLASTSIKILLIKNADKVSNSVWCWITDDIPSFKWYV